VGLFDSIASGVKKVGSFTANNLLGVDDFGRVVSKASKGDFAGAAKSAATGILELGSTVAVPFTGGASLAAKTAVTAGAKVATTQAAKAAAPAAAKAATTVAKQVIPAPAKAAVQKATVLAAPAAKPGAVTASRLSEFSSSAAPKATDLFNPSSLKPFTPQKTNSWDDAFTSLPKTSAKTSAPTTVPQTPKIAPSTPKVDPLKPGTPAPTISPWQAPGKQFPEITLPKLHLSLQQLQQSLRLNQKLFLTQRHVHQLLQQSQEIYQVHQVIQRQFRLHQSQQQSLVLSQLQNQLLSLTLSQ
jgi:hypothetical protein